jgi:hypothetical protein
VCIIGISAFREYGALRRLEKQNLPTYATDRPTATQDGTFYGAIKSRQNWHF